MDFASLMSQEISKAKSGSTTSAATSASSSSDQQQENNKKFISRREAEEARRAAYLAEQKKLEEERAARAAAKRKREEEAAQEARAREEKRRRLAEEARLRREAKEAEEERARRRRLGLPEVPPVAAGEQGEEDDKKVGEGDDEEEDLGEDGLGTGDTPEELVKKLRALGEPAVLFGEDHAARLRRYRKVSRSGALAAAAGPIATTLAPVEEKDMKVSDKIPPASDKKARRFLFRQLASYFNMILREWELALAREDNADTFAGQSARNAMISSKDSMRPLFRKFEQGDLDESILEAIVEIVKAAQERRYVDANDGYLRLSIGKAAWPIGVTMVGIHERSAREKLHGGERGHIMGSEVTRKYLQSIKRCLTFAQVRWPPEDIRQLMG